MPIKHVFYPIQKLINLNGRHPLMFETLQVWNMTCSASNSWFVGTDASQLNMTPRPHNKLSWALKGLVLPALRSRRCLCTAKPWAHVVGKHMVSNQTEIIKMTEIQHVTLKWSRLILKTHLNSHEKRRAVAAHSRNLTAQPSANSECVANKTTKTYHCDPYKHSNVYSRFLIPVWLRKSTHSVSPSKQDTRAVLDG